ncbi:hypothetical protein BLOT_010757 [Blomia tropicalis]|nr:hypothetical protein BLOT_010757 [Blomia tropicalis]
MQAFNLSGSFELYRKFSIGSRFNERNRIGHLVKFDSFNFIPTKFYGFSSEIVGIITVQGDSFQADLKFSCW